MFDALTYLRKLFGSLTALIFTVLTFSVTIATAQDMPPDLPTDMAPNMAPGMAADKPRPLRLPSQDIDQLTRIVCTPEADLDAAAPQPKVTAWSNRGAPGQPPITRANVECPPHIVTDDYAVFRSAACERTDTWHCGGREQHVRTEFDGQPLVIHTQGYNPALTYSLLSKIAAFRNKKGDSVMNPGNRQCSMMKGPSKELLDIHCDEQNFRLSYWCPQSSCPRIFSINGYFMPANEGGL